MMRRLGLVLLVAACRGEDAASGDSAFAEVQRRGGAVMGVDQAASTHVFEDLADGGRIVYTANAPDDSAAVRQIRQHLRSIVGAFAAGDFSQPAQVHGRKVPGTAVLSERRSTITWTMTDRPDGGEVRLTTTDPATLAAVREFLQFQRDDHRAAAHEGHGGAMDHAAHGAAKPPAGGRVP